MFIIYYVDFKDYLILIIRGLRLWFFFLEKYFRGFLKINLGYEFYIFFFKFKVFGD